jgi:TPR repeat protein
MPASAGQLDNAVDAYQQRDYATALRLLEPLAAQGLPQTQLSLGLLYIDGLAVPANVALAESWFSKAANQNFPQAEFALGLMYQTEPGSTVRPARGAKQWRRTTH